MKKAVKFIDAFLVIFLCLGTILNIFLCEYIDFDANYKSKYIADISGENSDISASSMKKEKESKNTENTDDDNLESSEKAKENKSEEEMTPEEKKNSLSEKLVNGISEYAVNLTNAENTKNINDFVEYLFNNYGEEKVEKLCLSGDYSSNNFYSITGKSLYVLIDDYMGNSDSIKRTAASNTEINMSFAGDICLAEDGFVLDYYDTQPSLANCIDGEIISKTNQTDIFMLNNEFCYSLRGTAKSGKLYTFRANPERVDILKQLGTDIVSLANNHVYDFGDDGFSDTLATLDSAGISRVGGGVNSGEAEKVIYYEINGMKIGIVSASSAEKVRFTPGAGESSPGIFLMYDDSELLRVVTDASKKCDFLIAFLHWGTEDSKYYETYQHDLAVKLKDAGVDAILGGHPHVLQGIEYIDNVPVIYSMGDFWFNNETKYTVLVNMTIDINGVKSLGVTPCLQSNFTTMIIRDQNEINNYYSYLRELSAGCSINDNGEVIGQ